MGCKTVQDRLSEFVDLELNHEERSSVHEHLTTCADCESTYRHLVQLKKLVHTRVSRPEARAELGNLIRRRIAPEYRLLRRPFVLASAATLALAATVASVVMFLSPPAVQLAHAEMVRRCLGEFSQVVDPENQGAAGDTSTALEFSRSSPPGQDDLPEDVICRSIRALTGVELESLPRIDNSELRGASPCSFEGVSGVRLDYRLIDNVKKVEHPLCVFVFSLNCLDCPEGLLLRIKNGESCVCVTTGDNTVYCFRSSKHVYNVVTDLDSKSLSESHRPRLP